ncbi:PQQ-like beta-propeller repeat protein [Nereida sp. MMG025]|uniref:PQQ-like beta-propeller repeat protein n=1 Tax=Nereida sp. MMG025 TaxID=2909981 RepID=UPI001F37AA9B|nr:PQQ-like beta-propeller repeat protein [Nereida sp. MMG025]MCF6445419.1 PQQ-like beta-propeller repeat protein [Nereida sp. MMG025]
MSIFQSKTAPLAALLATTLLVSGCAQREEILEGERLDLRTPVSELISGDTLDDTAGQTGQDGDAQPAEGPQPIALPAQVNHAAWTHRYGNALHRITHPQLSQSLALAWSSNVGQGNSRKQRITADPVVADGRVFTLDAQATVTATSTSGAPLWTRDLTPLSEQGGDASGGGLAIDGETIFVTTGYGDLTALETATGAELWTQRLEAPATGAPTVAGDIVYVVGANSVAWAINADNGRVKWQLPGLPSASDLVGGPAPVVTDKLVVFPFATGDLLAAFREGGIRRWDASVTGERRGRTYTIIKDLTSDPVVDGNVLYAGNQSGRVAALDVNTGDRIWTATEGAYSPVWPVDNAVFLVSDQAELVRLDASTGERVWGVDLPYFDKERDRRKKAVFAHYGPILAGGRLIVASDDGVLRSFDPVSGALVSTVSIPGGAASNPAVAGATLYVVSGNGQLHAFR